MSTLRPMTPADVPAAAALLDRMLGSGAGPPRPAPDGFLRRSLVDDPWADPELPSLVAAEDGRIVGMVTVGARRMRLAERDVRVAVLANLAVLPGTTGPVGVRLMQQALRGPQDASISDTASDVARRMWIRLGGTTLPVSAIHWIRVLAPWQTAADELSRRLRRPGRRAAFARLDRITPGRRLFAAPPAAPAELEPLTPESLLEALDAVASRIALRPAYDAAYLRWLFGELDAVAARGQLVSRLVRRRDGRPAGWFVYHLRRGARSEVLSVAGAAEPDVELVLDQLFRHAAGHGAAALRGRLEPRLVEPLRRRRCVFWYGWPALLQTADDELARAALSGDALLTRMEGEWTGTTLA